MDQEQIRSTANHAYHSDSIISKRLETQKIVVELEAFLRGERVVGYKETETSIEPVTSTIGKPLMNDEGIQWVLGWFNVLFNSQTVQGNKKSEEYDTFMSNLHADFASDLMEKLPDFDVEDDDYNTIVDQGVTSFDMFFSRTIDNLERESYSQTFRSIERTGEQGGNFIGKMNPFKGG